MAKRVITEKIGTCTFCKQKNTLVAKYKKGWGCEDCLNPPEPRLRATDFLAKKYDPMSNCLAPPSPGDIIAIQKLLDMKRRNYQRGYKKQIWDEDV